jgi:SAM-dependent methyltransferase
MNFEWTNEKIEFFERASEYTGFHKNLAAIILPHIDSDDTLIDVGCGLGLIDFELASYVKSVTAVDTHPAVIQYMQRRIKQSGLCNIFPRIEDAEALDGETWDVILMSFFGVCDDLLNAMISKAKKRAIVICHDRTREAVCDSIVPGANRRFADDTERFLNANGYHYDRQVVAFEFGQPLKSEREAIRFWECYASEADAGEKAAHMESFLKRLIKTENPVYPYYLPKLKQMAVFAVEGFYRSAD